MVLNLLQGKDTNFRRASFLGDRLEDQYDDIMTPQTATAGPGAAKKEPSSKIIVGGGGGVVQHKMTNIREHESEDQSDSSSSSNLQSSSSSMSQSVDQSFEQRADSSPGRNQ